MIGKFLPPHRSHHDLIDTALSECAAVVVIICEKPNDPIPGHHRQAWLQEMHPGADVRVIDDRYDENDSRVWAENTILWLGRAPDVVFTSEHDGDACAGHMGCRHVMVDQPRKAVPCSGTAVRKDPFAQWEHLSPPVRSWYAKRIVVVGAESTGTTTLAQALAEHFQTIWVPEYSEKQARGDTEWRTEEFLEIAREQTRRENLAAREANRLLIFDTNAFATTLWHRRYMGFRSARRIRHVAQGGFISSNRRRDSFRSGRLARRRVHPPRNAPMVRGGIGSAGNSMDLHFRFSGEAIDDGDFGLFEVRNGRRPTAPLPTSLRQRNKPQGLSPPCRLGRSNQGVAA